MASNSSCFCLKSQRVGHRAEKNDLQTRARVMCDDMGNTSAIMNKISSGTERNLVGIICAPVVSLHFVRVATGYCVRRNGK